SRGAAWMLGRLHSVTPEERTEARLRWQNRTNPDLGRWHDELESSGYLLPNDPLQLSSKGDQAAEALADARRRALCEITADWPPAEQATLARLMNHLADS